MSTPRSKSSKQPAAVGSWIRVFETSFLKYGDSIFKDHRTASREFARYAEALKELSQFGNDGLSALAGLLEHSRKDVRVTAAVHLLHYRTDDALQVLREAAKANRGVAMVAIVALKRWELGSYFDPATGKEAKFSPAKSQSERRTLECIDHRE